MVTNYECVIGVLATHREARRWSDEAVAADVLAQLGLDAAGEVGVAAPAVVAPPMPDMSLAQLAAQQNEQQAANDGAALQV